MIQSPNRLSIADNEYNIKRTKDIQETALVQEINISLLALTGYIILILGRM